VNGSVMREAESRVGVVGIVASSSRSSLLVVLGL
jgi:hypothetical protein